MSRERKPTPIDWFVNSGALGSILVYMFCGGALYVFFESQIQEFANTFSLKPVTAKVVSSGTVLRTNGSKKFFSLEIVHTYSVQGRFYTSSRYRWVWMTPLSGPTMSEIAARYKPGDTITSYYSGRDPSFCVINPAFGTGEFALLLMMGTLVALPALVTVGAIYRIAVFVRNRWSSG